MPSFSARQAQRVGPSIWEVPWLYFPYIPPIKCFFFLLKDLQLRSWRHISCGSEWLWCSKGMPCSSRWNFCWQAMSSFIHEDDKNGRYVSRHLFAYRAILNHIRCFKYFWCLELGLFIYWLTGKYLLLYTYLENLEFEDLPEFFCTLILD